MLLLQLRCPIAIFAGIIFFVEMELEINDGDPSLRFTLLEVLGQGSYGSVHKALDHTDGQMVAVKVIAGWES